MTRLGDFLKFLATNLFTKVAQEVVDIWAILKNIKKHKNCCGYYLGNFKKHIRSFFDPASGHTDYAPVLSFEVPPGPPPAIAKNGLFSYSRFQTADHT